LFGTDPSPTTTTTTTKTTTTTTAITGVATALISKPGRSGKHVEEEAYWARIDSFVQERLDGPSPGRLARRGRRRDLSRHLSL
jgi:hypothetical protein